jgi:chromosome segregation ATPase
MGDDITIEILKQIRDSIVRMNRDLSDRIDGTNERLDRVESRLGNVETRLGRVENGLNDLGEFMRQIARDQARHESFHTHHVDLLEKDVANLKERVGHLERHLPKP